MSTYSCSNCGSAAYYDGRCGDGPILMCGCDDGPILMCGCDKRGRRWVNDGRGGYYTNPSGAEPVEGEGYSDDPGAYDDGRH